MEPTFAEERHRLDIALGRAISAADTTLRQLRNAPLVSLEDAVVVAAAGDYFPREPIALLLAVRIVLTAGRGCMLLLYIRRPSATSSWAIWALEQMRCSVAFSCPPQLKLGCANV
ncbi:MAG: hypothetical protein H6880_05035 [Rhodobiaceae bacterium]|nr:hypothetical protein [Rhodobiaceae bacterium]